MDWAGVEGFDIAYQSVSPCHFVTRRNQCRVVDGSWMVLQMVMGGVE